MIYVAKLKKSYFKNLIVLALKENKTGDGEMTIYTVLLEDDTVGEVNDNTLNGQNPMDFDVVNVHLCDENGNNIEVRGKPIEILEELEV